MSEQQWEVELQQVLVLASVQALVPALQQPAALAQQQVPPEAVLIAPVEQ